MAMIQSRALAKSASLIAVSAVLFTMTTLMDNLKHRTTTVIGLAHEQDIGSVLAAEIGSHPLYALHAQAVHIVLMSLGA